MLLITRYYNFNNNDKHKIKVIIQYYENKLIYKKL